MVFLKCRFKRSFGISLSIPKAEKLQVKIMISNPHHHDVSIVWLQACLSSVYFSARVVFFIDFILFWGIFFLLFSFSFFFLSVCLCVCQQEYTKATKSQDFTRFGEKVEHEQRKSWWWSRSCSIRNRAVALAED